MECANGVVDMAETPRLMPVAVDLDRLATKRVRDERRDHHAVLATLPRPDGVEEPGDRAVQIVLDGVGESEELVHRLRIRIRPSALGRRSVDPSRCFLEGSLLAVIAVDLGGRSDQDALAEAMAMLEDELCATEIRDERPHGLLDDQAHPNRCGKVIDDVAAVDQLVHHRRLQDAVDDQVEAVAIAKVLDVLQ